MKYFASAATEGKSWSAKGAQGAECSSRHDPLAPLGPTIFDLNQSPMTRFRIESRRTLGALLPATLLMLGACIRPPVGAEPTPLASDRPSFSSGTAITQVGHPLLEAGMTYSRADGANVLAVGEATLRAGVSPRVELRLTAPNYLMVRPDAIRADGLGDAGIGAKVTLFEGGGNSAPVHPEIALLVGTSLPTGSATFGSDRALASRP